MGFRQNRAQTVKHLVLACFASLAVFTAQRAYAVAEVGPINDDEAYPSDQDRDGFASADEKADPGLWNYRPTGPVQSTKADSDNCDEKYLEQGMLANASSDRGQLAATADYMARCHKKPFLNYLKGYFAMLKDGNVYYDYIHNRQLKYVEIPNLDGLRIRGRLAMQPGNDKRPLVIFKCGIHCNLGSPSIRMALMLLFDEGPFHVLLLPSITGSDWQTDNASFIAGGFDEGRQIFNAARYVQSPEFPLANRVSMVHVAGFSLGGQAALYSAIYNDANLRSDGSHYITSVFAGCPAVDLQSSVTSLYRETAMGWFLGRTFWNQIGRVFNAVPVLQTIIPDPDTAPSLHEYPNIVARASLDYLSHRYQNTNYLMEPFKNATFETVDDYWKWNKVENFAQYFRKTPVFVWASMDDPVVRVDENSRLLKEYADEHEEAPLQVMVTPQGSHCAFNGMFGHETSGVFLRNYFLSRSPDLMDREWKRTERIRFTEAPKRLKMLDRFMEGEWRAYPNEGQVELKMRISRGVCPTFGSAHGTGVLLGCVKKESAWVDLETFDLPAEKIPTNQAEADALTRWLNMSVKLKGESGTLNNRELPTKISWSSFEQ